MNPLLPNVGLFNMEIEIEIEEVPMEVEGEVRQLFRFIKMEGVEVVAEAEEWVWVKDPRDAAEIQQRVENYLQNKYPGIFQVGGIDHDPVLDAEGNVLGFAPPNVAMDVVLFRN